MFRSLSRALLVLAIVFSVLTSQGTLALAGTTGTLNGQVADTANTAIAGAVVTASSPSQSASATTDASGHFTFVSLAPDTYTVTVSKAGYDPSSLTGISIFADQSQTVAIQAKKQTLKEIGKVTSRSGSVLVRAGTTADIYSVSAAQQQSSAALGGGGALNSAFSAIASVPGVFVPQGQTGAYQSVFVRGGNYTQLGYEYDGVPIQRAFDQYPGGNLSSLGQQELQVYTGAPPVTTGSTALAGFVNQVIRTGTYPGTGTLKLGFGSPTYYHQLQAEAGGASPNHLFSYYVGLSGYDQDYRFEENQSFSNTYGGVVNTLKSGCGSLNPTAGCYANTAGGGGLPLAPNGYLLGPLFWGSTSKIADRDTVVNLHFGLPHRSGTGRDDIQMLYSNTFLRTAFAASLNDFGAHALDILNGTYTSNGTVLPNCTGLAPGIPCATYGGNGTTAPFAPGLPYTDKVIYNGVLGQTLTASDLANTAPYFFPNSPQNRALGSAIAPTERDQYQQNATIVKLQYQKNLSGNAFLRILGYSAYSDWLQYAPNGYPPNFYGSISQDYKLGAHTRGVALNYTNQFSDKHLVNATASYTEATTFRTNASVGLSPATTASGSSSDSNTVAFLVDSSNPTNGQCYSVAAGVATPKSCASGSTARYILPGLPAPGAPIGSLLTAHAGDPTVATAGGITCGGGPCAYFSVNSGLSAVRNTVQPRFSALALQDSWKPTDRLLVTLGLRYDDFKYVLPSTTGNSARAFFVNWYNRNNCLDPSQANTPVPNAAPGTACGSVPANTGLLPVNFSPVSATSNDYPVLQPRIGATFTVNPTNVLRFSYGRFAQPASSAFQQYDTSNPNIVSFDSSFFGNGYLTPSHIVNPEISYNLDASWQHQAKGTDFSFAVTPYLRKTRDEIITVVLDPKTNFVSGINVGLKTASGVELAVEKGDLKKNGLYAKLAYTYTRATVKYTKLPNGTTVLDSFNNSVKNYNGYTSFCSTNPSDARCPSAATLALTSSPCFSKAGAALGTKAPCSAATVANPYWNMPARDLFDVGASYPVYSTLSGGNLFSGSSGSYIVPHVFALVLNYKHDKLNITPTFQLQAGGVYGRPTDVGGINPRSCKNTLPGAVTVAATDPRYSGTSPGGAPYDASTCGSSLTIPDPFTGNFDTFGAFRQPTKFSGNLQVSYDLSPHVTLNMLAVNVVTACGGGSSVPWAVSGKAGCVYSGAVFPGNFYNPGDSFDQGYKYPYRPNFGNVFQSSSGGQANPLQVYVSAQIKL